jgi:GNAT superfamily N-acetyltransferase
MQKTIDSADSDGATPIEVRVARHEDAAILLSLIDALAAYEQLSPPDAAAKQRLIADGFESSPPRFEAYLAFESHPPESPTQGEDEPIGYAIALETYSTFLAMPTLYIEDIFVLPRARGRGVGSALFRYLAGEAVRRGCGRMEWTCLDWNVLAIGFYERHGGEHLYDWRYYRLTGERLQSYAGHSSPRMPSADTTDSGSHDKRS